MADKTTKVVLDLDNKEFVSKLKESLGLLGEIGKSDSVEGLVSQFAKIGMVAGVAGAAILAVKVALDLTKEAEHVRQVENSFEVLAKSAGLAGDTIKKDLIGAAKGLADDTDLLQAANKAIVAMGENAKVIPQTMEMARKATILFGGDLVQNFENINQAIASGNTRSLKQYGIIIDTDKVVKDYAKSIGTTADMLSEAGKKQAIMNAALEQGRDKFKNVDESQLKVTTGIQQAAVAWGQLKEAIALAFETIEKTTHIFSDFFKGSKWWLDQFSAGLRALTGTEEQAHEKKVENVNEQIKLQGELQKATENASASSIDYEKLKEGRAKFEKELADIKGKRAETDLESATSAEQAERAYNEKIVAMHLEFAAQKEQIKKDFYDKGIITEQQYQDAIGQINQTEVNKLKDYNKDLEDARIKSLEKYAEKSQNVSEGITRTFAANGEKNKKDFKDFAKTGEVVWGSVKKNSVSAFKAMGDGSKTAGEAMRGFMFGAIADTAEAKGTELLLWGIGEMNPGAIAGGGALIALAQALRSSSEGSKGVGGASASGGGGGGGGGASAAAVESKPEVKAEQKKTVSLNIAGNYFDTDQSRTRIMEMIRESGDFTDFNISRIGPG